MSDVVRRLRSELGHFEPGHAVPRPAEPIEALRELLALGLRGRAEPVLVLPAASELLAREASTRESDVLHLGRTTPAAALWAGLHATRRGVGHPHPGPAGALVAGLADLWDRGRCELRRPWAPSAGPARVEAAELIDAIARVRTAAPVDVLDIAALRRGAAVEVVARAVFGARAILVDRPGAG